jgi:type 1 glutamine amidotransferase
METGLRDQARKCYNRKNVMKNLYILALVLFPIIQASAFVIKEDISNLDIPCQVHAMNTLLHSKAPEADAIIVCLSRNGDGRARVVALENLGYLDRNKDVAYLVNVVREADAAVAEAAMKGLAKLPNIMTESALRKEILDGESELQSSMLEVAVMANNGLLTDTLMQVAEEEGPNQTQAIRALGKVATTEFYDAVMKNFLFGYSGPDKKTWQTALWDMSMRQLDAESTLEKIRSCAKEASPEIAKLLESMADKLETLQPEASIEEMSAAVPRDFSMSQDVLLPGSFEEVIPSRFEVAAYLNCGIADKVSSNGIRITCVSGSSIMAEAPPAFSHHQGTNRLEYRLSGLDPTKEMVIGFTWWEQDQAGRRQSIWINGREVLPEAHAIAYDEARKNLKQLPEKERFIGRPTPVRIQFSLQPEHIKDDTCRIVIRKVSGPDVVNSELWVAQRTKPKAEKQVLLLSGQDYPGHHWRKTGPVVAKAIEQDKRMEVTICESPYAMALKHLDAYDVVFIHFKNYDYCLPSTSAMQENLKSFIHDGGGMCLSHFACGAFPEWPGFVQLSGRIWNGEGHDKRGPFTVNVVDQRHPVTKGLGKSFETDDELYFCLMGDPEVHLLCEAFSKRKQSIYPQAFTYEPGKGRVFLSTLGHDVRAYDAREVKQLYRQGVAWAAKLD